MRITHHSAFSGSMLTTSAKPASAPSGSVSTKPLCGNNEEEKENYNRYKCINKSNWRIDYMKTSKHKPANEYKKPCNKVFQPRKKIIYDYYNQI